MKGIVAFHLGAGIHSEKNRSSYKALCYQAAQKAAADLSKGSSALDLVTECTVVLENSPLTNAGIGSNLTTLGTVECDASVMEGSTCAVGAVGSVSGVPNPVLVAKSIALQAKVQASGRVMPCMLVGDGALSFAQDHGISTVDPARLITAQSQRTLRKCRQKLERFSPAPDGVSNKSFVSNES
ncbi:hypothetical protein GE061_018869 [Apolygus lucorum]|uniref:Threonine aspartase 1 n=1 Tax=Apolygus lucorum TaxID=248454 RepID=A0A6A4JH40_APOLU|nr:hypothetical protein GE061_018869 [Apolygus lucorum]